MKKASISFGVIRIAVGAVLVARHISERATAAEFEAFQPNPTLAAANDFVRRHPEDARVARVDDLLWGVASTAGGSRTTRDIWRSSRGDATHIPRRIC